MNIGRHMIALLDGSRWRVTTKKGDKLGSLEWNRAWRTWEFVPQFGTAYTPDCLRALAQRCDEMTAERLRAAAGGSA